MYFFTLASSSKGNCALVCSGDTKLLIDAGLSAARLEKALQAVGERPEQLTAILITHEHTDHVQGVARLAYKYSLPVYATPKTWGSLSEVPTYLQNDYSYGLQLGDLCWISAKPRMMLFNRWAWCCRQRVSVWLISPTQAVSHAVCWRQWRQSLWTAWCWRLITIGKCCCKGLIHML